MQRIVCRQENRIERKKIEKKNLRAPGFEPGLPRPQRGVLTTILSSLAYKHKRA